MNNILRIKTGLDSLAIYRALLSDGLISKYRALLGASEGGCEAEIFISLYAEIYHRLTSLEPLMTLEEYILFQIVYRDNIFAKQCENSPLEEIQPGIAEAAGREIAYLIEAASLPPKEIKVAAAGCFHFDAEKDVIMDLPEWDSIGGKTGGIVRELKECGADRRVQTLARFYRENGSGIFARYKGFVWEQTGGSYDLKGIADTDPVRLSDLAGYELERKKVVENTLHLLHGHPANNILLYGDSGTGKSSTVKAILNEYSDRGLRMIELPVDRIGDFPLILRRIVGRRNKFIIFLDDLAFEDSEAHYTALKAVLEGSLESRPQNVVIYATSNRRHLIKEKVSDRIGMMYGSESDEIHARDAIQEKNSLAERFGITVTFQSPDKEKYLMIVENIARQRGIPIDRDALDKEALIWETWQNGRSPRTARQFVDWLEGKLDPKSDEPSK